MIILAIDPGYHTGVVAVDTTKGKILGNTTIALGIKAISLIEEDLGNFLIFHEVDDVDMVLVQVPVNMEGKTAMYARSGKISPVSLLKNGMLSGFYAGYMMGRGYNVKCISSQSQRGKGMKMDADLFYRLHPEVKRCSEHVRDAANMALGYNEIGG